MKKIISLVLTAIMLLSTTVAFAAPGAYGPDTVITKDNVREILIQHGLDPSNMRTDKIPDKGVATVGELEKAMKELDNTPKRFVDSPSIPQYFLPEKMVYTKAGNLSDLSFWNTVFEKKAAHIPRFTPMAVSTGTKTCYRNVTYTNSLVIGYWNTGYWYKNVPDSGIGPTLKYWTGAGGAGEDVNSNSSGTTYVYELDKHSNTNTCVNPSTTSSYLKQSYNYDVTVYISVLGQGLIPYNNFNISGYQTYDISYI